MWREAWLVGFAAILLIGGCDSDPMDDQSEAREEGGSAARMPEGEHKMASARIESRSGSNAGGEATLMEQGGVVQIVIRLENAPPGPHAAHIHEVGDCSAPDASSAGEHWNPTGQPHGRRGSGSYHLGDLGNVEAGADGTGVITIMAEDISLEPQGGDSALGKAIVIHSAADDFTTQPDGAAGERIGCGVIETARLTSGPSPSASR